MLTGDAGRGGAKFAGCGAVVGLYVLCVLHADPSPYHLFLWTVAAGVCCRLIWPSQDEGAAFLRWRDDNTD